MLRFPASLVPQACEAREALQQFEAALVALEAMLPASAKPMVIAVEDAYRAVIGSQRDLYEGLSRKGAKASVVRQVLDT